MTQAILNIESPTRAKRKRRRSVSRKGRMSQLPLTVEQVRWGLLKQPEWVFGLMQNDAEKANV